MSRRQKLIEKWRDNPPTEESFEAVKSVLNHFGFTCRFSKHYIAYHEGLKGYPDFPMGEITIPTIKGKTVKGFYIKRIVVALELLGALE